MLILILLKDSSLYNVLLNALLGFEFFGALSGHTFLSGSGLGLNLPSQTPEGILFYNLTFNLGSHLHQAFAYNEVGRCGECEN